MTNSIEEIKYAKGIFVIGANPVENHPVIGSKIRRAKAEGARLVVADPRKVGLAKIADIHLPLKPGTNVALVNGIMNIIISKNLVDKEYLTKHTEGYEELVDMIREYTPEKVADICELPKEDIIEAAKIYALSDVASIFYAMGVTQHSTGTNGVISLSNLALITGNIGKLGGGLNPLRGQNNVQGACDMGCLPNNYPGYQKVTTPEVQSKFKKAWDVENLSEEVGLTVTEVPDAILEDRVKLLYIMGENPVISDPDTAHITKALKKVDFLIVQDLFLTETAEYADIVLPAGAFAEKDGTFTNTERKIQRIRKAVDAPGEAKADWIILSELLNRMGVVANYTHPREIMEEIAEVTPQYGGISYERISNDGLQWPCPTKGHPGTKFLHENGPARGKGLIKGVAHQDSAETPCEKYPIILTTGRNLYHFHTKTMTGRVEGLNIKSDKGYVEVNPKLLKKYGIEDGERIKVTSRRGSVETTVRSNDGIISSTIFMPFHFAEAAANILTNTVLDSIAKIPELKVSTVRIEKIKVS